MSRLQLTFPQPVVYTHRLPVRINDINYGQHLGHDRLVTLLHEARCAWLAAAGYSEIDIQGTGLVIADLQLCYQAESFYGDTLDIQLALGELGSKSAQVYHQVVRVADQQVIATARTTQVFFDYQTRKPTQIPEAFKRLAGL